ncbi:MAG: ABC transporter permease [Bacteroidales bacterium]
MKQFLQLTIIQFKEFYREPAALFWSLLFPILMAWGLGIAFSGQKDTVRNIAVISNLFDDPTTLDKFIDTHTKVVRNSNDNAHKHTMVIKNEKLGTTTFNFFNTTWDSAIVLLKRGSISLILDDRTGDPAYHFDLANAEAQLIYLNLKALFSNQSIIQESASIRPLTISGTRYIDFLVPGLMAMGIMSSCLWGISYSLIEKRSKKLLRRMVATPMKKSYFLASQFVSRLILSFLETAVLILFAYFYFNMHVQGSIAALVAVFISGNFAFIGIAILISSRTANTQVGNGLINAVTMPMMVLSGIFFSYYNFPEWTIPIIRQMPLTLFADSIRSIFTEGAGFFQTGPAIGIMTAIGLVSFVVGLRIFKWT